MSVFEINYRYDLIELGKGNNDPKDDEEGVKLASNFCKPNAIH